ncbi:MAG: hypothetical protein AAF655_21165 [Bacteroidota bacterium]
MVEDHPLVSPDRVDSLLIFSFIHVDREMEEYANLYLQEKLGLKVLINFISGASKEGNDIYTSIYHQVMAERGILYPEKVGSLFQSFKHRYVLVSYLDEITNENVPLRIPNAVSIRLELWDLATLSKVWEISAREAAAIQVIPREEVYPNQPKTLSLASSGITIGRIHNQLFKIALRKSIKTYLLKEGFFK